MSFPGLFVPAKNKQTCKSSVVCKGIPHANEDLNSTFVLYLASYEQQLTSNLQAKQKHNKFTQNLFPFFKVPKYI